MDDDDNGEDPRPLKITFSGPAEHWTDAIPIGNGRLGAMIWGGVALETLQLNGELLQNKNNPHRALFCLKEKKGAGDL